MLKRLSLSLVYMCVFVSQKIICHFVLEKKKKEQKRKGLQQEKRDSKNQIAGVKYFS